MSSPSDIAASRPSQLGTLLRLSVPIMLANLLQTFYNLVDAWYLGRVGAAAVSAPAIAFSVIFFLSVFGIGFSLAGTTLVAQAHGAGDARRVDRFASHTLTIVTVIGVAVGLLGFVGTDGLLWILRVPADSYAYTEAYMRIIFAGIPFMFFYFVLQSVLQGVGDSMTPLKIQLFTIILNVALDPIFIFGWGAIPRMEVAGAAIATVISRGIGALIALWILISGRKGVRVSVADLIPDRESIRAYIEIGLPNSIGQSVTALGFSVLQGVVNGFGTAVVAAFGVANRIIGMFNMPAIGLSRGIASLVGQRLGANEPDQARDVVRVGVLVMLAFITPSMALTFFFGNSLVQFFVNDAEVIAYGATIFRIVSVSVIPFTLFTVINGAFQGGGDTKPVMILNIGRLWGLRVPLAIVLSGFIGPNGIWIAMFVSNIVTATVGFLLLRTGRWLRRVTVATA